MLRKTRRPQRKKFEIQEAEDNELRKSRNRILGVLLLDFRERERARERERKKEGERERERERH